MPCRDLKQFARFPDALKSSLKKKSVKYFNRPKPCGLKKCLCVLTVPHHHLVFFECHCLHSIQFWGVHLTSACGLFSNGGFSKSDPLPCGYISPCFLFHSTCIFTTPSMGGTGENAHSWASRNFHQFQNLFRRVTILIHRFQIWTGVVLCSIYFGK